MTQPVSIIITCFNLERYVGEAIRSVIGQQFGGATEIIVVDDCSSDGSAAVIRSFPAVRYVRTERNGGVMLAMLAGIRAASGDLLFFLDGDDVWEPGKLAACVNAFESSQDCALVTHDLSFIDAEGAPLDRPSRPGQVLGPLPDEERSSQVIDGILRHGDFVWLGSAMAVRRSLGKIEEFDRWARALPDPANTYQDWPLAFWVASLPGVSAAYVPQKLFRYRLHGSNHSGDATTAARAVRNFTRAGNTVEAMRGLAVQRNLPASVCRALGGRMRAYEYLLSLHRGRRAEALRAFPAAVPDFLGRGELGKELIRLGAILLIGPDRVARLAARRSAGRA